MTEAVTVEAEVHSASVDAVLTQVSVVEAVLRDTSDVVDSTLQE